MITRFLTQSSLYSLLAVAGLNKTAHASESAGFPQLDISTYPSQIFWLTVSFVVLYTLMSKIALPRIANVLDMRRTKRESELSRAEEFQKEVEEIRATYEKALAKSHDEAQKLFSKLEADMTKKAAEKNEAFAEDARLQIEKSEKAIAQAKAEALDSIADVATEIAADAAGKISGANITKANAEKAVKAVMKEAA